MPGNESGADAELIDEVIKSDMNSLLINRNFGYQGSQKCSNTKLRTGFN